MADKEVSSFPLQELRPAPTRTSGLSEPEYLDEFPEERKVQFSGSTSRRWKITTALFAVVALGLLGSLLFVELVTKNDSCPSSGTGSSIGDGSPTTEKTPDSIETTYASSTVSGSTESTTEMTSTPSSATSTKRSPSTVATTTTTQEATSHTTSTSTPTAPSVVTLSFRKTVSVNVAPDAFYIGEIQLQNRSTVTLTLNYSATVPVSVAIYWRKGQMPTHTQYDVTRTFNAGSRQKRTISQTRVDIYEEVLSPGKWFVALYNGHTAAEGFQLKLTQSPPPLPCPNDCSNHGTCLNGTCFCQPQWQGVNCSDANCLLGGCSERGKCQKDGSCLCRAGWTGADCSEVDCIPSDCSNNGICNKGVCSCDPKWKGSGCSIKRLQCPRDCSGHGLCDDTLGICTCDPIWVGIDCNTAVCTLNCSDRGICDNGTCICNSKWTGQLCELRACLSGCERNGRCYDGNCACSKGWKGKDCLTDACPSNCNYGNGSCVKDSVGDWHCVCNVGYRGYGCEIGVELVCGDGLDNDGDRLLDCDDPDCCNSTDCITDPSCVVLHDPVELVSNTTSNGTMSFYDTIDFLFSSGLQQGYDPQAIDKSRISVAKGRVRTRDTSALIGATVTILNQDNLGYTTTRRDGSYDIAVKGGGLVTLRFTRRNFITAQRPAKVGWNEFVYLEDVVLIPLDDKVTEVDLLSNDGKIKVASGSQVVDEAGARQGVVMIPPNTEAVVVGMNGTSNMTVERPRIRITEYTVGPNGVQAMPAELPTFTGYTYAVEMSIDQATVNGSTEVVFNQTLPYYVDNYLGFPVGSAVPIGFYNRTLGEWVASPNGRVIEVLAINETDGKKAVLDVSGDGKPATRKELNDLGITEQEVEQLAVMYSVNQTLWRVPIRHFTPWDCNWPYGPPPDGCSPFQCRGNGDGDGDGGDSGDNGEDGDDPLSEPEPDEEPEDPCAESGSIIISQTQTLGEVIGVSGTDMVLFYFSNRMPGYYPTITIPLTRSSVPPSLKKIHLVTDVNGQTRTLNFAPQRNLKYDFAWNRRDGYGRFVSGKTTAMIKIGYEYGLVYYPVRSEFSQSFNRFADATVSRPIGRRGSTAVFWDERQVEIGGNSGPVEVAALGGWSLNVHHSYDPQSGTLYFGNGKRVNFKDKSKGVKTVVGTGSRRPTTCTDCLQPTAGTSASLLAPVSLTTSAEGNVYVGDYQLIRYFTTEGNITTIIDFSDHPPKQKYYTAASTLTGSLFISYPDTNRVYRVQANLLRVLTAPLKLSDFGVRDGADVFAGTGIKCAGWDMACGDSGAARDARLMSPKGIAVGPGGTVYLADGKVIRQISSDGMISTFVGSREPLGCAPPGCRERGSNDVRRDQAFFHWPTDIAVKQDDESLMIVDNNVLLEITRNGLVRLAAGRSAYVRPSLSERQRYSLQADELFVPKKSTTVDLRPIHGLAVKRDGTEFFSETDQRGINRIRLLTANRKLLLFAGVDPGCDCQYFRCTSSCFGGDGGPAVKATFFFPTALSLSVQGEILFVADQGNFRVRAITVSLPRSSASGFYAIPSTDGKEIYTFDVSGRHVSTLWTPTGKVVYTFQYSDYTTPQGTKGLLASITDAFNETVTIERDDIGVPTSIVSPFKLRSNLKVNGHGYLNTFTNVEGYSTKFSYDGNNGLLKRLEDQSGLVHTFDYNSNGRLVKDSRPDGGYLKVQVERSRVGRLVKTTSRMGRMTSFLTSTVGDQVMQIVTGPSGERVVNNGYGNGTTRVDYADGSVLVLKEAPHPIWGDQRKIVSQQTMRLPSGLTKSWTITYNGKLKEKSNPLSISEYGHTVKVNNVDFVTVKNTVEDRTQTTSFTQSSPSLETVVTYDQFNQPVMSVTKNGGLAPQYNYYTSTGLKERTVQGKYDVRYEYDSSGRLHRKVLPNGEHITYSYDGGELVKNLTLPSGRKYGFAYDASGIITAIFMPSGAQHSLSRKISADKTSEVYSAPGQAFSFSKDFNSEGDLVLTRFPSGNREVRHYVDKGGRVIGMQFDHTTVDFSYGDNTSRVAQIHRTESTISMQDVASTVIAGGDGSLDSLSLTPMSSLLIYGYDGPFVSTQTQESADQKGNVISTAFSYQMDSRFRLTKRTVSVDGATSVSFDMSYDNNNRPTKLGVFSVYRTNLTDITMNDGTAKLLLKFDSNNRIIVKTLTVRNSKVFSVTFQYDKGSRIIVKNIQAGRSSSLQVYQYEYDVDGQLLRVRRDGRQAEWYSYDANGNRIGWQTDGKTNRTATYSVSDSLTGVDSTTYQIDDDGFLIRKGVQKFEYNSKGELIAVRSISGDILARYGYDGLGRRVMAVSSTGKTTRFLYGDISNSFRITHIHEEGIGVTTLHYDVNGAPIAFERLGRRYYLGTDHLGTPFIVTDSTGQNLKILQHSAYGVLLSDSNPAEYIPFHFAAGVREDATAHLYFTFRDYDPDIGRWTSRDPSLYSSQQPNLYQYVLNDPVNFMDPLGLFCIGGSAKLLIGLGVKFCFDRNGVSLCGDVGVGVGGGVTFDVLGEPSETKVELFAEATAGIPFFDVGVEATAGFAPFKPSPCQFQLDVVGSAQTPIGGFEYSIKNREWKKKLDGLVVVIKEREDRARSLEKAVAR